MNEISLTAAPLIEWGPLTITGTVVTTWGIVIALWLFFAMATRDLHPDPGPLQTFLEMLVSVIEQAIANVAPQYTRQLVPFIGSFWIYLVVANLVGLIPGLHSPTRDLSATSALAVLVFLSTHWFGIRDQGLLRYLRHYLTPTPLLLPFHIVSEITRSVALAVRLFGNMMSLEIAALLVLVVAGFLAPVPILMLHVVEALVQAYIFGMLALIYVAGSLQSHQMRQQKLEDTSHV